MLLLNKMIFIDTAGDGGERGYSELSVRSVQFFGKFKHVQKNVIWYLTLQPQGL